MSTLFVDADACPVTREAITIARQHGMSVVLVANTDQSSARYEGRNGVETLDRRHRKRLRRLRDHRALGRRRRRRDAGHRTRGNGTGTRGRRISPRGRIFYLATIDIEMEVRHAEQKHRRAGGRTGGPSKFTDEDREHFSDQLERLIRERRR